MLRPDVIRRPIAHVDLRLWGSYALVYVLPVAVMSLVDTVYLVGDWSYGLFLFAVLVVLAITPQERLRLLPLTYTIVGGLSCLCPLIDLVRRPLAETVIRLALAGNGNTLIVGSIGGATVLAASVTVRSREFGGVWTTLIAAAAFGAGMACVVLSNTRSVLLALLYSLPLVILFASQTRRDIRGRSRRRSGPFFAIIVIAMAISAPLGARLAFGSQQLQAMIDYSVARFSGAASVFSDNRYDKVDASSQSRLDTIRSTFDGITPAGAGISQQIRVKQGAQEQAIYPHFTYLQVFYDFGVPGALLYTLLHLVIPIYLIQARYRRGVPDGRCTFVMIYYLYNHIDYFTHATPYSWSATLPVALVYIMLFPDAYKPGQWRPRVDAPAATGFASSALTSAVPTPRFEMPLG